MDDPGWHTARPRSFQLSEGDGRKTVHAWTKDRFDNISSRATASTFLDTRPPRQRIDWPRPGAELAALVEIRGIVSGPAPSSGLSGGFFSILRRADCSWWDPVGGRLIPGQVEGGNCRGERLFRLRAGREWVRAIGTLDEPGKYTLHVIFSDRAGNRLAGLIARVTSVVFVIEPAGSGRAR